MWWVERGKGEKTQSRISSKLWFVVVSALTKQHNAAPAPSSLPLLLCSYDQFLPTTVTVTAATSSLLFLRKHNPSLQALLVRQQSEQCVQSGWWLLTTYGEAPGYVIAEHGPAQLLGTQRAASRAPLSKW